MKHLKRIVAFTLTLVLLMTVSDFSSAIPTVKAERIASGGTTYVPETPEELLSSGEWKYWVDDGVAYIAGYKNTTESSLKIPGSLGSYPVVGIGHNAFSENKGLKSIQIHTNVTCIADDAFGNLYSLNIKAYHGSYALHFAHSHNYSASNLTSGIVFQPGVIDLTGLQNKPYSNLSETQVIFQKNEATFLRENQILYFPKQTRFPDGLVKRVTSIVYSNDQAIVSLAQPGWEDVVDELSGNCDLIIDWNHATWYEGFGSGDVGPSGISYDTGSKKIIVDMTAKTKHGISYTLSGSIKTVFGTPTLDYEFKGLKAKYITLRFPVNTTPELSITIAAKDKERYRSILERVAGEPEPQKKLKIVDFPVITAGGLIASVTGTLSLYFKYSISAEGKVSCTIETTYTYTYVPVKITKDKTTTIRWGNTELTGKAKIGPELSFYITVRLGTLKVKIIDISVGVFVEGKVSYKRTTFNDRNGSSVIRCCDISVEAYIESEIKMGVLSIDGLLGNYAEDVIYATIPVFTISLPDKLAMHYEPDIDLATVSGIDSLPERCSLKNRLVVFENNNGIYNTAFVDVGSSITAPKTPTRTGYKFDGWYVNTKKSALSGTDYKFDFRKDVMPYIKKMGNFYLYAKWTLIGPVPTTTGGSTVTPGPGTTTPPPTITPTPDPVSTPTPTPVPIHVSNITLDQHNIEIYNDDSSTSTTLHATVSPTNADDSSVTWESDNTSIVNVNNNGEFVVGNPGTAIITCRSVSDPEIYDTCTVIVKQHVQQIYVEGDKNSLLPGETAQMTADCFPENANDKSVTWSSGNNGIATVDQTGKVTAVGYGDVVITATTNDGSNLQASFAIRVEHELALEVSMINDTAIKQSDEELLIAYITPTSGSMRRMAEGNHELQWSLTPKSGAASARIEIIDTTFTESGITYNSSFVSLIGTCYPSAGDSVFTIICNAGPYEEAVDVTLTVDGTAYADKVKLNPSTFYLDIDEAATIPNQPLSADSKPVPQDMQMKLIGDTYYNAHATENTTANGASVAFNESGVYTATVQYRKANISYEVPVTFYVQDSEGIIHIRVDDIELNQSFLQLVQGDKYTLTATVMPNDAYNKEVIWSSSNSTIASVSSTGRITAKKPGTVAICCEAKDNSGVFAICAVTVEAYLQLDEDALDYTVYKNADDHTDLGIINLTWDSQQRLSADDLNVTWKLTRNSGSATEIALEEFKNTAEDGVSVSGNIIKLIRINAAGDDVYTLTCSAGSYSDSCIIRIHVLDEVLPDSVSLSKSSYEGIVDETISIDLQPICSPTGTQLPEDTLVTVDGNRVFLDALSSQYSFAEPGELVFAKAGTYFANVVFTGNNYSYTCPVTITVKDEDGTVPKNISDIIVSPERSRMLIGETVNLSATVLPTDAAYSNLTWSSSDTSIVSVSSAGVMTAIGAGTTTVLVTAPETDIVGGCLVIVEDGLTMETDELERTVFVDGTTRMQLDTVMLTEASSMRQTSAPEWTLTRDSGNNLTLRAEPYQTTNSSGQTLYGCKIILYSVSRVGDTVYELSCSNGTETATAMITVHAVNRDSVLPAGIEMLESTFTANINELIVINPTYVCYPTDTTIPNGMKVSMEGDRQFTAALNTQDFFISQSLSTVSFNKAGTYHATYLMEYANARYVIPLLFRIKDSGGNVPVQASEVKLNCQNLNMVVNDTVQLEAVFSPVDTTNQSVIWQSSDTSVVTVNSSGKVTAVANGMATITCTPADTEVSAVTCAVTVEDYLTVIPGNTSMVLYIQGEPVNAIADIMLSVGTIERLNKANISPEWNVGLASASHAQLKTEISSDNTAITISSVSLLSAGTDTYTVSCTAGNHTWQLEYTLIVRDVSGTAPTDISMKNPRVTATLNQPITIDFTPVLTPSNAQIPSDMRSSYVGLGDFYDARDYNSYVAEEDTVTVTFTKAGQYILARRYRLGNMQFVVPCVIQVGGVSSGYNLLTATETEFTVYDGGKSGSVSTVSLNDHMVETLWGDSIKWSIQRVSGNSMNVALKRNGTSVEVFVVDAEKQGTDVWRVTAEFGGLTDSIDISLTSAEPRGPLPQSLILADDTITGVIGTWINIPLSVACLPAGSMLPDQGDEFWSVEMDAHGMDRSRIRIENGLARFSFVESGYYTATFKYHSGNVAYSIPVYFEIRDEEEVVGKPALQLFLVNASTTVYPEGEVNVAIAQAIVAETMSTSNIGASLSYMNNHDATWSVTINSGTAANLTLVRSNANAYDLVLTNIKASGNITYTVACNVDGETYSKQATLHVASNTEERPDPTLLHTSYQVVEGEHVIIDRKLYSKKDGSVLQSSSTWNPSTFLAAAGYEIQEAEDNWLVTFYKTGTYSTTVDGYASNLKIQVPLTIQVIPTGSTVTLTVMKLPAALTKIEEEAFRGVTTNIIDLRGTSVTTIGSAAFMDCVDLIEVYLPENVISIADDAFYGCLNVTFHCQSGSYAESFANAHGISVTH